VTSVRSIRAERHFTQVQAWVQSDPLQTFLASNEAYRAQTFEGRYRVQLALALESLVLSDTRAKLTPGAADRVWIISASAGPNHPAVLVARAQYLLNSGRWRDSDEIERVTSNLKTKAKTYPQTWMVEAYRQAIAGNSDLAADALLAGLRVGGKLEDMRRIANAINMEIEEQ
jgi:hypothetical protein